MSNLNIQACKLDIVSLTIETLASAWGLRVAFKLSNLNLQASKLDTLLNSGV